MRASRSFSSFFCWASSLFQAGYQVSPAAFHQSRGLVQLPGLLLGQFHRLDAAHRLDAPDARGDGGLGGNFAQAQVPGALHVGAAAELLADLGDGHHPDVIAVFFLEQGGGPARQGLVHGHLVGVHRQVGRHGLVQVQFDGLQLLRG